MKRTPSAPKRIVCFGAACVDRRFRALDEIRAGTSNPAIAERGFGGVARNVAENLARLGIAVALCSVVGDDEDGRALVTHLRAAGVDASGVGLARGFATPQYAAIVATDGELFVGAAEMEAIESLTLDDVERLRAQIDSAVWLFVDCNLPPAVIAACIALRRSSPWRLAVDAVSTVKAQRLPRDLSGVDLLFLNEEEARACSGLDAVARRGAGSVVLLRGPRGAVVGDRAFPAPPAKLVDVTGAGDALVAGTLFGLLRGESLEESVQRGLRLASLTVESASTVREDLKPAMLSPVIRLRSG